MPGTFDQSAAAASSSSSTSSNKILLDKSKVKLTIEFDDKDCIYDNFLINSDKIYPKNLPGVSVKYDAQNFKLIYKADSLDILRKAFEDLRFQQSELFAEGMRQQTALMVVLEEIIEKIEMAELQTGLNSGGMGIDLVQAALQCYFKYNKTVFVPGYTDYEILNRMDFNKLNEQGIEAVIFSLQVNAEHQAAVYLDIRQSPFVARIYDSLEQDISEESQLKLRDLLGLNDLEIVFAGSYYSTQDDHWSCGIHVIENLVCALNQSEQLQAEEKPKLDVNRLLTTHYRGAKWKMKSVEKDQSGLLKNIEIKKKLLDLVEGFRFAKGFFTEKEQHENDILKPVADLLQIELWGNLHRQEKPEQNKDRLQESNYSIKSRSLYQLYEANKQEGRNIEMLLYVAAVLQNEPDFESSINFLLYLATKNFIKERENSEEYRSKIDGRKYSNKNTRLFAETLATELAFIKDASTLVALLKETLKSPFSFNRALELIDVENPLENLNLSELRHAIISQIVNQLPGLDEAMEMEKNRKSIEQEALLAKKLALTVALQQKLKLDVLPFHIRTQIDASPLYISRVLNSYLKKLSAEDSLQFLTLALENKKDSLLLKDIAGYLPTDLLIKIRRPEENSSLVETLVALDENELCLLDYIDEDEQKLREIIFLCSEDELRQLIMDENASLFLRAILYPDLLAHLPIDVVLTDLNLFKEEAVNKAFQKTPDSLYKILSYVPESKRLEFLIFLESEKMISLVAIISDRSLLSKLLPLLTHEQLLVIVSRMTLNGRSILYQSRPETIQLIFEKLSLEERLVVLRLKWRHGNSLLHDTNYMDTNHTILTLIPTEYWVELLNLKNSIGETVFFRIGMMDKIIQLIQENLPVEVINQELIPPACSNIVLVDANRYFKLRTIWNRVNPAGEASKRSCPQSISQLFLIEDVKEMAIYHQHGILPALKEGLITVERIRQLTFSEYCFLIHERKIRLCFSENGRYAMREGYLDIDNIPEFHLLDLRRLEMQLSEYSLKMFKEGFLTPEQFDKINTPVLELLMTKEGLRNVRDKLISPEQICEHNITRGLLRLIFRPDVKALLNEGLFSLTVLIDAWASIESNKAIKTHVEVNIEACPEVRAIKQELDQCYKRNTREMIELTGRYVEISSEKLTEYYLASVLNNLSTEQGRAAMKNDEISLGDALQMTERQLQETLKITEPVDIDGFEKKIEAASSSNADAASSSTPTCSPEDLAGNIISERGFFAPARLDTSALSARRSFRKKMNCISFN